MNSNDELKNLWQQQPAARIPQGEDMLTVVIERTRKLDRQIASRNTREAGAALLLIAIFAVLAWHAPGWIDRIGWGLTSASGVWIVYYMRRFGAGPGRPDRDASVAAYTAVLEAGYDKQIQLLRTVKYWYLLPMWCGIAVAVVGQWLRTHQTPPAVLGMGIVTAGFIGVWILNERYGVRYLERLKAELPRND